MQRSFLSAQLRGIDADLRILGGLIGRVDAREILQLPLTCLPVQTLDVALFGCGGPSYCGP